MLALGIVFIFAGYSVGSWGYCLVKGYDIPLREWLSPLHPYQWPKGSGTPPLIPSAQLFPGAASSSAARSADSSTTTGPANPGNPGLLRQHDRPPVQ